MRGNVQGLGFLQYTPTGIALVNTPTCVTQAEWEEAQNKCREVQLRGLGQAQERATAPMTGRLASYSPCQIKHLSVCPQPRCMDLSTAGVVAACIGGGVPSADINCNSLTMYAMAQLPLCGPMPQTIPSCLAQDQSVLRSYCQQYNEQGQVGPDKQKNALCWLMGKDRAWWNRFVATPACGGGGAPSAPPSAPPAYPPTEYPPPGSDFDLPPDFGGDPETSRSGMFGVGSVLLLLAAAGGGYYLYRRSKR